MEERKFINVEIEDFEYIFYKSHYLDEFIKELQSILEANKDKYEYLFIRQNTDSLYDNEGNYRREELKDYEIVGCREETDEEYQKRIEPIEEREERCRLQKLKEEAEKKEERRKLYLELREEFDGEEK